jgi:hypothetical protein
LSGWELKTAAVPLRRKVVNNKSPALSLAKGIGLSHPRIFLEPAIGRMIAKSIAKRNDVSQSTLVVPRENKFQKKVTPMVTSKLIANTLITPTMVCLKFI